MPCERVHYHAKVGGTSVLLWGGDFYNSFSFFLGQRFYRIGLCLYCFWHLNDSTLTSEKKTHIKSSSPFLFVGSLAVLMALPPLLRIINLGLITRNYIVKNLLLYIWCMFRSFFVVFFFFFFFFRCFIVDVVIFLFFFFLQLLLGSSFVHLFTNVVSILHFFFLSFRCFFKIPWTCADDKFVIRAKCLTVNPAFFLITLRIFST